MLRYMRSSEAKGNGDGTGNETEDPAAGYSPTSDDPARQASPTRPGTQQPVQAIHAPVPLPTRQQLAEAAKLRIPSPSRGTTPVHQSPSGQTQYRNGSQPPPHPDQQQQQIWEDSSINSMFAESVATTTRPAPRVVNVGRHGNQYAQSRRAAGGRANEQQAAGTAAAGGEDPYVEGLAYGSPSRPVPVVKQSKYALRDARAAARPSPFTDLQLGEAYSDAGRGSPEQRVHHQRGDSTAAATVAAGLGGLGLGAANLRGGLFRDTAAPLPLGRTPYPPETDESEVGMGSDSDEAPNQRTPRQNRAPPPDPAAQQQQQQPALPHKRVLHDSSLPRVGGGGGGSRRDRNQNLKRHHSPDYDDSMLHSMSYAELRDEPFDHDPARMAVQAPAVPANLSLEDRLGHFQTKEATSQRHFFTEMSVQEWDESGDWFLDRFAELTNKIREKRQEKRRVMAAFEAEVTERENTVRHKADSIERTLGDLRNEGEGMMRNRVVDF